MKSTNSQAERRNLEPSVPADLGKALHSAPKAKAQWDDLTPIARMDFISWIESAKQSKTRSRRVLVACSKLESGQRRPCCYSLVPMELYRALAADTNAKAQWGNLTPIERRGFIRWVNSACQPDTNKSRIKETCMLLATGKKHP